VNVPVIDRRIKPRLGARAHLRTLWRLVFWHADTTTIRLLLAIASLVWGIALLAGPCQGIKCLGASRGLNELKGIASLSVWAAMFFLHFVLVMWRFVDQRSRPGWALLINSFGLGLWLYATIAIITSLQRLTSGTSLELVTCFFAAWALYRTGINDEISSP